MPTVPKSTPRPWQPVKEAYSGMKESNQSFYQSKQWKRLRLAYRLKHPLCEQCAKEGRTTTMHTVDHIVPINQGGGALDWNNLQSLCKSCNAIKTGKQRNGGGSRL